MKIIIMSLCLLLMVGIIPSIAYTGIPLRLGYGTSSDYIEQYYVVNTFYPGYELPLNWEPWTDSPDPVSGIWEGWGTPDLERPYGQAIAAFYDKDRSILLDGETEASCDGFWIIDVAKPVSYGHTMTDLSAMPENADVVQWLYTRWHKLYGDTETDLDFAFSPVICPATMLPVAGTDIIPAATIVFTFLSRDMSTYHFQRDGTYDWSIHYIENGIEYDQTGINYDMATLFINMGETLKYISRRATDMSQPVTSIQFRIDNNTYWDVLPNS